MSNAAQVDRGGDRRKWITGLVAGALTLTAITIALAFWWSGARQDKPLTLPQTLPADIHQQLSGYSFTRSEKGRQIFTVHAARTVAFKEGGTTVLQDVFVEVFGRTGSRHDVLRARQCDYNAQSGDLLCPGTVEIELNAQTNLSPEASLRGRQPVYLETSQVSFQQQGLIVATDEPVKFRTGLATGSAQGLIYATKEGWLELKKDVRAELAPTPEGRAADPVQLHEGEAKSKIKNQKSKIKNDLRPPMRLSASRLRYESPRRQSGEVVLGGPLEIAQGTRRVVAGRGTVFLDDQNRVTSAVLEGGARAFDSSEAGALEGAAQRVLGDFDPASGELRNVLAEGNVEGESRRGGRRGTVSRVGAQQFEITFWKGGVSTPPPHRQPESGSASGDVRLTFVSSAAAGSDSPRRAAADNLSTERKNLTASQVRFTFRPEGWNLQEAQTVGPGQLVLDPPGPTVGERVITAGQLLMAFDTQGRPETLRGLSHTRAVFQPPLHAPVGSLPQESSSDNLEATFDPATQALRTVEQVGDYQFREGDRQARAEQAQYSSESEVLTLTGHPLIWDANTRIGAERIVLNIPAGWAEGLGKVQSTHFEGVDHTVLPGGAGLGTALGDHKGRPYERPRNAGPSQTTNVLADRMLAERRSQFVHYEGHVRAWHGQDVVESSSLDVYRKEQRVSSGSSVLTSHLQPAFRVQAGASRTAAKPATRPVTIRADRLEGFEQGRKASYRGNVQLQTENTTLKADRVDLYFSTTANLEASEVERAVADGHVTVVEPTRHASGEHAEYYAAPGKILVTGGPPALYDTEKGFTTGQRLTFFIHDDRLLVDGGNESPALSQHRISQ